MAILKEERQRIIKNKKIDVEARGCWLRANVVQLHGVGGMEMLGISQSCFFVRFVYPM